MRVEALDNPEWDGAKTDVVKVAGTELECNGTRDRPCPAQHTIKTAVGDLPPGPSTIRVTATDALGNSVSDDWSVKADSMPPVTELSGSLVDADEETIALGESQHLLAEATDGDPSDPQSGVTGGVSADASDFQTGVRDIRFAVDGVLQGSADPQSCPQLNCALARTFEYVPAVEGLHTISVTTTDQEGNEDKDAITVRVKRIPHLDPDVANVASQSESVLPASGARSGDHAGRSVASLGDINRDYRDDYAVGAPGADPAYNNVPRTDAGSVYVVTDGSSGPLDLGALGTRGFRIDGPPVSPERPTLHARCGMAVAPAGDVNGDKTTDLLVGCPDTDGSLLELPLQGRVYVVFGGVPPGETVDLANLGSRGFEIRGPLQTLTFGLPLLSNNPTPFGWTLTGANVGFFQTTGDINHDGRDDIVIGSSSESNNLRVQSGSGYVVFGKEGSRTVDVTALHGRNEGFRIDGAAAFDQAGYSVASPGDLNRDEFADLVIAAPGADPENRSSAGTAYVVFGKPTNGDPATDNVDLAKVGAPGDTQGYRIDGATNDKIGTSAAALGDVNGGSSNQPDFALGGHGAYVVFGKADTETVDLARPAGQFPGYKIAAPAGSAEYDNAIVTGGGDINNDRVPDTFVSFSAADSGNGRAYLVYGQPRYFGDSPTTLIDLASLPGERGSQITGSGTDKAGASVDALEAVGHPRARPGFVVGAPDASTAGGPAGGAAYAVDNRLPSGHAASAEDGCGKYTPAVPDGPDVAPQEFPYPWESLQVLLPQCRRTHLLNSDIAPKTKNEKAKARGRRVITPSIIPKAQERKRPIKDAFGEPFLQFKQDSTGSKQFRFYPPPDAAPDDEIGRTIRGEVIVSGRSCMGSPELTATHVMVTFVSGPPPDFLKAGKRSDRTNEGRTRGGGKIDLGIHGYISDELLPPKRDRPKYWSDYLSEYYSPCVPRYPREGLEPDQERPLLEHQLFPGILDQRSTWEQYQSANSMETCRDDPFTNPDCGGFYSNYHRPLFRGKSTWNPSVVTFATATTGVHGGGYIGGPIIWIRRDEQPYTHRDHIRYNDYNVPCGRPRRAQWLFGSVSRGSMDPLYGWWPRRRDQGRSRNCET